MTYLFFDRMKRRHIIKSLLSLVMAGVGCTRKATNEKEYSMEYPIEETLKILKNHENPEHALNDLITLCSAVLPKENWSSLPKVNVARDISELAKWLSEQIAQADDPSGIYLGIDTENRDVGDGHNLDFTSSKVCEPTSESLDWLDEDLDQGDGHLIDGLYLLQQAYTSGKWSEDSQSLCDYILFLGYSGIIVMHAFKQISIAKPTLVVWGFHDGDILRLILKNGEQVTRICAE